MVWPPLRVMFEAERLPAGRHWRCAGCVAAPDRPPVLDWLTECVDDQSLMTCSPMTMMGFPLADCLVAAILSLNATAWKLRAWFTRGWQFGSVIWR